MITIKHKVLKDFQLLTPDKKIIVLKAGSILEEYKYGTKSDFIKVDRDIIDNNPNFFQPIDWKMELVNTMKAAKIPQPGIVAKKIIPFIDEMILSESSSNVSVEHDKFEEEYKEKLRRLKEREIDYDAKFEKIIRKEKELESLIELNNDKILKRSKEIESDLEFRSNILSKKESEIKNYALEVESRESNLKRKSSELQIESERLREYELELKKKERELDNNLLMTEKDVETKQKDLQEKIKSQLFELERRERDYNDKLNRMESLERTLSEMRENIDRDSRKMDEEFAKRSQELEREFRKKESNIIEKEVYYIDKIRGIKSMLELLETMIPWVHLGHDVKQHFNNIIDSARQIE